ncbi:MAG: NAD(P)/FAD-dependent oxidoreductase [Desulfobacterales bacterium]|nr:NAD(P)/FAD-dependent oxidoreductase [Desulfobacterales bacterium]
MKETASPRRFLAVVGLFLSLVLLLWGCGAVKPAVSPTAVHTDFDVIIVGGGLSGLSAGAHLASSGLKVLLCEQHDKVGGCATRFDREPFVFDSALHQMAGGGPGKKDRGLYQLLKVAGVDRKVELYELPHFYRSLFPGVDIRLPGDWDGFKKALKAKWPEESEGIEKFHRLCENTMNDIMEIKDLFRYTGFKKFTTMAMVPFRQPTFFKYMDKTLKDLMDDCFTDENLKAVVSQLWVYYGAPVPDQTALLTLAATEGFLADGVWHIKGTSQELSSAYAERIEELGGTVMTSTPVTKIHMVNGMATGIDTEDGSRYTARYIVANTDPYQLAYKLIGKEHFPEKYIRKLEGMKPANSLCGVYLGLNIDLRKRGYDDTEIFINPSTDTVAMYDAMMRGDFENGAVVVSIYSNFGDPVYAPPGKSLVTLTSYSKMDYWPEYGEAYDRVKGKMVDDLLAVASKAVPELADPNFIEHREGFTPRTLKRYTMNKGGVVYGFYMNPEQIEKIPNTTPFPNVFIASNWTQAWHGVGSAQINGWRAARLVLDREGRE